VSVPDIIRVMGKKDGNLEKIKRTVLPIISGVAFVLILWLLFYGKVKASTFLAPIINKLPKDETGLMKVTEQVLGAAVDKVKGDNTKKIIQKGSEVFEESQYAAPAREVRNDVKKKLDEVVDSAKELPTKEVRHIQEQICREWLGAEAIASSSGVR
jgi:hypothetical protein